MLEAIGVTRSRGWIALRVLVLLILVSTLYSHFPLGSRSVYASSHIIYVNVAATGSNNGSSWANAYTSLHAALGVAANGKEIWVAAGVYKPTTVANDRAATFQLKNGVAAYGGFAGTETALNQRNWTANRTILSGDIDNNDNSVSGVVTSADNQVGANSFHVVTGSGTDNTAILDGVIITAGQANGAADNPCNQQCGGGMLNRNGSPRLTNVSFSGNSAGAGGGMYNFNSNSTLTNVSFSGNSSAYGGGMHNNSSSLTLTNVSFSSNYAGNQGGGMLNLNGNPTLTNVSFSGNHAKIGGGGGLYNASGNPILTNLTFSGNRAESGGAIYNLNSNPTIQNSIIWHNQSAGGVDSISASILNNDSNPIIRYSLVQGCMPDVSWSSACGIDGGNNLANTDPLFVETPNPANAPTRAGNLRLQASSPAINKGNNADNSSTSDLAGNVRKIGVIDLGPYERVAGGCQQFIGIRYVNQGATQPGNGITWNSAYRDLQDALQVTGNCDIWVAAGVYKPTDSLTGRVATFQLKNGVAIYGGFAGMETALNQRNWTVNRTILSGDIDNDDISVSGVVSSTDNLVGANSFHVVTGSGTNNTAILDGVIITAGQANGAAANPCNQECGGGMYNNAGNPTLRNLSFHGNYAVNGGGMINRDNSSPTLTNVSFSGNYAKHGGGMYNSSSSPALTNVSFSGNSATFDGGGMYNWNNSSPTLTNVSFSGNSATINGGGMVNNNSSPTIRNSIFWRNRAGGNEGTTAASMVNESSSVPSIRYSLVQGCKPGGSWIPACGTDGGNNLADADPLFVETPNPANAPTTGGNLRLQANSPAINQGNSAFNSSASDLAGNVRKIGIIIDLGPYERVAGGCPGGGIRYVNQGATLPGNGLTWNSAYRDLQDALQVTGNCEIWVAAGVYKPTDSLTGRAATFQLKNGVAVYGGFAGTETALNQRNWTVNRTILSGDIDNNDISVSGVVSSSVNLAGANSFHVVTGSGTGNTAILDGVIITAGQANDNSGVTGNGGGLYNNSGNPMLANVSFSGNYAEEEGGGMYNGQNSSPTLTNVSFSSNSAKRGGGMFNWDHSSPTLANVSFSSNSAVLLGGGMFNRYYGSPTLTNVSFSGNSAETKGGGMFNYDHSDPMLTNVSFSGNHAENEGGGMYNGQNSSPTLTNVSFSGNSATTTGGGMHNNNSSPTIQNSVFWRNRAGGNEGTTAASMVNESSSAPTIRYSLVQGCNPSGQWNAGCGTNGGNNLADADPLFVDTPNPANAPTLAGNLRLKDGSPAINRGDDSVNSSTVDLAGNPRKVGIIDLGAYENQTPVPNVNIGLSANPPAGGAVEGGGSVAHGATVTVKATANNGYSFVNWTEGGNQVSTSASYNFTATANRTLVANFSPIGPNQYSISVSANPAVGGTVSGGGVFNQGASVTVEAEANTGYTFVNWTEGGTAVSTSANYTFQATTNRTLVANFANSAPGSHQIYLPVVVK
jgi:hypothetical protein